MTQLVLVQMSLIDKDFSPKVWLKELFNDGILFTGAILPPVANIITFWISVPWESDERFDLSATEFADRIEALWEDKIIQAYISVEISDEPGTEIQTWESSEREDEDA